MENRLSDFEKLMDHYHQVSIQWDADLNKWMTEYLNNNFMEAQAMREMTEAEKVEALKIAKDKYYYKIPLLDFEKNLLYDHYKKSVIEPISYQTFFKEQLATDPVNRPAHYTAGSVEVIDMMERIWGMEAVIIFCELNAFKYRQRAGLKNDGAQDLAKAQWYESHRKKLLQHLNSKLPPAFKPPLPPNK